MLLLLLLENRTKKSFCLGRQLVEGSADCRPYSVSSLLVVYVNALLAHDTNDVKKKNRKREKMTMMMMMMMIVEKQLP